jgi:hypothetical protein
MRPDSFGREVRRMSGLRRTRSATMHLRAEPEAVFPLLCPVREYDWIDTWRCEMIHSDSGLAEPDCVFKTSFPSDGPEDTWVVARYESPQAIEFVRTNPLRVMRYTIALRLRDRGHTEAVWTQVVTGLNDEGDRLVASMNDEAFTERMGMLERMLNHYLATGRMLKP